MGSSWCCYVKVCFEQLSPQQSCGSPVSDGAHICNS